MYTKTIPTKHRIKEYSRGNYFHVYNRGVEKRDIFVDENDCKVFLHFIDKKLNPANRDNLAPHIQVLAYCLMPNHFHLLLQSKTERGIERFMRSIMTSYSMYFNKKQTRIGHLYQERYQARKISTDADLLNVSKYIHRNPKDGPLQFIEYPYSSFKYYLLGKGPSWLKLNPIYDLMPVEKEISAYSQFVAEGPSLSIPPDLREPYSK